MVQTRITRQKEVLQTHTAAFRSFFTAEDLHKKVTHKGIGIATVYRFLDRAVQEGEIHSYSCNRRTIYSRDTKSHCHFTCERCRSVKHITLERLDFLRQEVPGDVCHFEINISGICERCKTKDDLL